MLLKLKQKRGCPVSGRAWATIFYLTLLVLIPLSTLSLKSAGSSWGQFWHTIASPRVFAAIR